MHTFRILVLCIYCCCSSNSDRAAYWCVFGRKWSKSIGGRLLFATRASCMPLISCATRHRSCHTGTHSAHVLATCILFNIPLPQALTTLLRWAITYCEKQTTTATTPAVSLLLVPGKFAPGFGILVPGIYYSYSYPGVPVHKSPAHIVSWKAFCHLYPVLALIYTYYIY